MSVQARQPAAGARPVLKWAGGKRQLLPQFRRFYPPRFGAYFEPFAGSAAVFLDLHAHGLLDGRRACLADSSPDLIGCYMALRDEADAVIAELERLAEGHRRGGAAHFYLVRDGQFNPRRAEMLAALAAGRLRYPARLAAMLLYLNRTGYNGLFRLNSKGRFNVPAGRYDNPRICDAGNLRRVAAALAAPGVELRLAEFDEVLAPAGPGDLVYLDPPYAPLSATARFTAYTAGGFGPADQVRLQQTAVALARRGCLILLSNSTAPEIARLYERSADAAAAGLRTYKLPARRAINARADRRGDVLEYLVTNLTPRGDPV